MLVALVARERGTTGVHTHVRELRRHLSDRAQEIVLVTPHSWADGSLARKVLQGVMFGPRPVLARISGPAHVRWYRASHEYFLRRALRDRLRHEGPCTVYAQCPVAAKAALAARTGPSQRVVLAVHFRISQADEWVQKGQIARDGSVYRSIRRSERAVLPRCDGLVFVSQWARSVVQEWMPEMGRVPGVVVPNFVGAPEGRKPGAFGDLISVGSLEPAKNHRFLLRVLAAARVQGHVYTLDIYGEGVERSRLAALAEELGVADQVRLRGFCTDVQQRLRGYRTYVHASYSESSSLAIMEAMAVGLPIVSSSECALGELFEDPAHGRFWPIDDAAAAARILIALLESPDEARRAGREARAKFLHDYDAAVVAPKLLTFLRSDSRDSEATALAAEVGTFPRGAGPE